MKIRMVVILCVAFCLTLFVGSSIAKADLGGSRVEFAPSVGGAAYFIPGQTQTLCFKTESITSDGESVSSLFLKFPSDWMVGNPSIAGTRSCTNGGSITGPIFYGLGPGEYGLNDGRTQSAPDDCTAFYCFQVTAGTATVTDAAVSWSWYGANESDPTSQPHFPCSSDGYNGPLGDGSCDQAIYPPAIVPIATHEILDIQPATLPVATVGFYYIQQLTASGAPGPFWWNRSVWSLPDTMYVNNTGELSGWPTAPGSNVFTINVQGSGWSDGSREYTLNIYDPLTIGLDLPAGNVGVPFSQQITVSGGTGPYTIVVNDCYECSPLPAWLSITPIDSNTGTFSLSGTPTATGIAYIDLKAMDANGVLGKFSNYFRIDPEKKADAKFTLISDKNPSDVGDAVLFTLSGTGTNPSGLAVGKVNFFTGAGEIMCANVQLNSGGVSSSAYCQFVFGTQGYYPVWASYTDDSGFYNDAQTTLEGGQTVNPPPKKNSFFYFTSSLNPSTVGQEVIFTLSATGTGTLPPIGYISFSADGQPITGCEAVIFNFDLVGYKPGDYPASCKTSTLTEGLHVINAYYMDATDQYDNANLALAGGQTVSSSTYTLTYTAGKGGTILGANPQTVNSGGNGSEVEAKPNPGYHFVMWSDFVKTANRTDINVKTNLDVTAEFGIDKFVLSYTAGNGGTILGINPQIVNYADSGMEIEAKPDPGYQFVKWSDNVTTPKRTEMNVMANLDVTATFSLPSKGAGWVTINNIPASPVYQGSFTPSFNKLGDGETSTSSSTPTYCTVSSTGNVSFIRTGTCTLVAHVTEGTNYLAANGATQSFTIRKAPGSVTINNIPTNAVYGGSFTPVFVKLGNGHPWASSSTTSICKVDENEKVKFIAAGTCILVSHAAEGTFYLSATGIPQSFTIVKAPGSVNISNLPLNATFGGSFTPRFNKVGNGSAWATSNSPAICMVSSHGLVTYVGAGTCTLMAHVAEGTYFLAATGVTQSFTINKAPGFVWIKNLPEIGKVGGSFTPSFFRLGDGVTSVSTLTPSICTVSPAGLVKYVHAGTCKLTAFLAEGTNYLAAQSGTQSFYIRR